MSRPTWAPSLTGLPAVRRPLRAPDRPGGPSAHPKRQQDKHHTRQERPHEDSIKRLGAPNWCERGLMPESSTTFSRCAVPVARTRIMASTPPVPSPWKPNWTPSLLEAMAVFEGVLDDGGEVPPSHFVGTTMFQSNVLYRRRRRHNRPARAPHSSRLMLAGSGMATSW